MGSGCSPVRPTEQPRSRSRQKKAQDIKIGARRGNFLFLQKKGNSAVWPRFLCLLLRSAKAEVAFRGSASPGADNRAVARDGVLDLAVENEVVHSAGLVLRVDFKV